MFGVPEAFPSDRGINVLTHLMMDVCTLLGIEKLNTTSHNPECHGIFEQFNCTLKTMLRKHASYSIGHRGTVTYLLCYMGILKHAT